MLKITRTCYDEMVSHLRSVLPNEGCGLLGGSAEHAYQVYPIENIEHSPVRYLMNPKEQIEAIIQMENADEELVAIFHSHPRGEAFPSATDLREWSYPQSVAIIFSFENPDRPVMRGFWLEDQKIEEVELRLSAEN